MKKVFKAFFLKQMRLALEQGLLILPPDFPSKPARYHPWKENLYAKDWVVHTKKPFAGVQHVVKYLARYSHLCLPGRNHRQKA
ncbi:MAG: transposase [Lewinellaceae bacterium]|nr:transposase [Lewinellaceae bacterium]